MAGTHSEDHIDGPIGARTIIGGREVDYFAGSGYLGLQGHPAVIQAAQDALLQYGFSTATSRGGYGEHVLYDELESEACAFFGDEKVLYLASGYLGMSAVTQATSGLFDHIFIDASAHFSAWDAAQATNKPITPFHHCQVEHLLACLKRDLRPGERPLVLSDGVFPVSGEIAPLPGYLEVVQEFNGLVYLDDAHAAGVLGEHGRGTQEYFRLAGTGFRSVKTLAKGLGGFGGLISGDKEWIEAVERNSRICVGASPPPLAAAAASAAALRLARTQPELRNRLRENVARMRAGLRALGWPLENTPVPIICLDSIEGVNLLRLRAKLFARRIAVEFERAYTSTPPGGALRIAIFSTHSMEQIDRLVDEIGRNMANGTAQAKE